MAHIVRPENAPEQVLANAAPDEAAVDDDGVCIDLRGGDLSDDEVVSILLGLARERAATVESAAPPDPVRERRVTEPASVLDEAANGPRRVATYPVDAPRRRRWPVVVGVAVAVVIATVLVVALRSRPAPAVDATAAETGRPAAGATDDPDGAASPSTSTPVSPTTAERASATRTEAERTEAFCTAVATYTLDDLPTLAEHGVSDPRGTIEAYAAMVANAPPEIADDVTALGPITGKVQAEIETGAITTPEQMQQYLAGGAPADEVGRWITAQQAIVAELPRLCPEHPTPSP